MHPRFFNNNYFVIYFDYDIYPENFETKIGFDRIRQLLSDNCLSPMGKNLVNSIRFENNAEVISFKLSATYEFQQILQFDDYFPSENYFDLTASLNKIRVPGSFPEVQDVFDLKKVG